MDYPNAPIFNDIFDKLHKYGVSRETHGILCTLYENGQVGIPLHQDNEPMIEKGSEIFTISFGATRKLKIYNTEGALKEFVIPLVHGSVYSMSRDIQSQWRHGIDREPDVKEPRVSFTIRKLTSEDTTALSSHEQSHIPPIAPPPVQAKTRTSRVLLITDSLHKATPEHVFEKVPDVTCVKKECYELTNIFQFEPDFKFAQTVIMSCGVNDLSRYGKTANSLADLVCRRLEESCNEHRKTNFVFNSLVYSKDKEWLNREIDVFNEYMFELSMRIPNLSFYDSHGMILNAKPRFVWDRSVRGNGIHLCFNVRRMVIRGLVDAVGKLNNPHSPKFRECRWLLNSDRRSWYKTYG